MVNNIFGKLMQNNMKQSTLKIGNGIKEAIRLQSMPGFVRNVFSSGNITIADVKHDEIRFDRPIYVGGQLWN